MVATGFATGGTGNDTPLVLRLVAADGGAAHLWCAHLASPAADQRDVGDAVHALCLLHGHHPCMADAARDRVLPVAEDWLAAAAAGFVVERAYLARLAAAAGPLPSTAGHAESQAAIDGQRHALGMLARSERSGCALGAVAALVGDWDSIRRLLDAAATRYGVPMPASILPDPNDTTAMLASIDATAERAVGFGATQLLAQHRGLWSLLEARAEVRERA